MKLNKKDKILSTNTFPVVGIGASAGGLEAFKKLLKAIPEDSGMAYVLVQHLHPGHESMLPDLLQKVTNIPVLEISDKIKVEPNHIYVIPSNKMLVANDGMLILGPRPLNNKDKRHLPIDLFFASLAEVHQSHAIGVVLSGTASDGTAGLKAIKDHGGITFAQDEESADFGGMPHSAVQSGAVDFVLDPAQIPAKILEVNKTLNRHASDETLALQDDEVLRQIISLLRIRKGTDFTYYKQSTISRRVLRRMAIIKTEEPAVYLKYLKENKAEQDILYQDLLIPVTSFFRDEKSFINIKENVIPVLAQSKAEGESVRVWVAGCSTGEEAYTLAICFKEYFGKLQRSVQIFATDISEPAIEKARLGIYSKNELSGLSDQRIKNSFTKTTTGFQVNRSLRELCVFAVHNFLKDPPFGKMDLITCRNVLIYMGPYLQKRALTTFHYALNPKGFLLLGKTETINSVPELFALAGKHDKLFTRKNVPGRFVHIINPRNTINAIDAASARTESIRMDFQKTADEIVLSKYTPAGVIVNDQMDIVHFRGNTSDYLEQSGSKPSHNLLKMAKQGLAFELRTLLHKTKKEKKAVLKEHIPFLHANNNTISIEAIPLPNTIEPYFLILFHEEDEIKKKPLKGKKNPAGKEKLDAKDLRIEQLEKEVAEIHEDMNSITEEQEAANEELQSDNEELLSSSEELQSLNEELETSKEELQSTNEELTVVNQEIINLNDLITDSLHYTEAIIDTIREPLLVLDKNLKVKTANNSYYELFQVIKSDTEGHFIYDVNNRQWDIPDLRKLLENILPEKTTFKDFRLTQTFPGIGHRVMSLNASELRKESNSEKLILLAMEDITERIKLDNKEKEFRKRMDEHSAMIQDMLMGAPAFICTLRGPDYVFELVNEQYQEMFGNRPLKGLPILKALPELAGQGFVALLDKVYNSGETFKGTDYPALLAREVGEAPEQRYFNFTYQPIYDEKKKIHSILVFGYEVTEIVNAKNKKAELDLIYKRELEEKVRQRTKELLETNEELKLNNVELGKINSELKSFTYVASHDLQEPLRKIQTFANRLLEKETDHLSENGKDYFHRMQKAAFRMQQLITDLLAFSRVNTSERIFEKTDLNQVIANIKNDFKEIIEEKHATIEASELCEVNTIKFQFYQVMQNLIGNALKFSDSARAPHITITSKFVSGSQLNAEQADLLSDRTEPGKDILNAETIYCHISVADNGIGFDPQYKDRIFELFQKLHSKDLYNGTGIGLSIVKKIVENHKGLVTASSELGKGSTFHIYLPK